jgi:hypothetical protein
MISIGKQFFIWREMRTMGNNQTNKKIYEELKYSLVQTNKKLNNFYQQQTSLTEQDSFTRFLNVRFNDVLAKRGDFLATLQSLQTRKLELFQNLVAILSLEFYSVKINNNSHAILNIFDIFSIVNSALVKSNIAEYMKLLGLNLSGTSTEASEKENFRKYFDAKLTELIKLIKSTIEKDSIRTSTHLTLGITEEEYKILYLFYKLSTSVVSAENDYAEITRLTDEIFYLNGAKSVFFYSFYVRLDTLIKNSLDSIRSFLSVEEYRKNNTPNYSDAYIKDILTFSREFNTKLEEISDIFNVNFEEIEFQGIYEKIKTINVNIRDSIENFLSEFTDSVILLDNYIENYSPFANLPIGQQNVLAESLNVLEELATLNTVELNLPFQFNQKFFSLYSSDTNIKTFSEWTSSAEEYFSSDIYTMFMLYFVSQIKQLEKTTTTTKIDVNIIKRMINYNVLSMVKDSSIPINYITDGIDGMRVIMEKEKNLETNYSLKVFSDVNNDLVPSTLKILLPKMESLDYITFKEYLDVTSGLNVQEFEDRIVFLILEEIARKKKDINRVLGALTEVFSQNKVNFKTLFVESAVRKALKKVLDYIKEDLTTYNNSTGEIILNETVLESSTIFLLDSFVSGNALSESVMNSILADYRAVWNFYYNNSYETLIDLAIKPGDLKDFLNQ